ncbi:hypothetical protein K523DRAFT_418389 [Schizophyllum commune Tattone D]|nr:hypothetical protein K523DRAFT_418389 [Schizophyllum commune Tattone D]
MGQYRRGVTRRAHLRSIHANAAKSLKDKENVAPGDSVLQSKSVQNIKNLQSHSISIEKENRSLKTTVKSLRADLKNALAREQRKEAAKNALCARLAEEKTSIREVERRAEEKLRKAIRASDVHVSSLEDTLHRANAQIQQGRDTIMRLEGVHEQDKQVLHEIRRTMRRLETVVYRARALDIHFADNPQSSPSFVAQMKFKHAYSVQIRSLVRHLLACGCSKSKIGAIVQDVGATFGVRVPLLISRRSAGRMALEGLMMARAQLGHEMRYARDITFSGDSTSRRNQNYQAHHVTYRTQVFKMGADGTLQVYERTKTHFLGIRSTLDHSADASLDSWMKSIKETMDAYNMTPLERRDWGDPCNPPNILVKVRGMHSDHASVEKATAEGMRKAKMDATLTKLGEERRDEMPLAEFQALLARWNRRKVAAVGGDEAWAALSREEQASRDLATVNAIIRDLGEEALSSLPDDERRLLTLFVWTGCCMHKDQNSFKGGNTAMMATWKDLNLTPPILLANKACVAAARKTLAPETGDRALTDGELAALEASTRGGAKTTALAGAIFHNHSDKKGQGDTHINYMTYQLSSDFDDIIHRFPQTNNTRFGSHGEAAGELLVHLREYIRFLRFIKTKKQTNSWTNIELNVYRALHDQPTLTELAVLALYQQIITHPYMKLVRARDGEELNAIDLGPLHAEVREHCERLISCPEILLDFAPDCYVNATFDGRQFHRPDVVAAVQKLVRRKQLPYLRTMFVSFLKGAVVTWIRFSSEYAPGGLIDGMSMDEKAHVFLNATNDRNEGALGAWCVWARNHATSTMHQYNALAMYITNETENFVQAYFGEDDYVWAMRAAREYDASGIERRRRREQAAFEARVVEMKRERIEAREVKNKARREKLAAVDLISDLSEAKGMTGVQLSSQLALLREMWGKRLEVPPRWSSMRVADKARAFGSVFLQHLHLLQMGDKPVDLRRSNGEEEVVELTMDPWYADEDDEMDTEED